MRRLSLLAFLILTIPAVRADDPAGSVKLGDLDVPVKLMQAIEKAPEKSAILDYLTNSKLERTRRLGYLEGVGRLLLSAKRPQPKRADGLPSDFEIPAELLAAINKSESSRGWSWQTSPTSVPTATVCSTSPPM